MVLPLVKLGSLAFRTLRKPIAARLKHDAGIHPKYRGFTIGLAQAIKEREEELASEVQTVRQRIIEIERQSVGWGSSKLLRLHSCPGSSSSSSSSTAWYSSHPQLLSCSTAMSIDGSPAS